ncbi:MAG: hypothetical protein AVDCRST_MAG64-3585, partial [uncultured Phycisphaerae bacterium]
GKVLRSDLLPGGRGPHGREARRAVPNPAVARGVLRPGHYVGLLLPPLCCSSLDRRSAGPAGGI